MKKNNNNFGGKILPSYDDENSLVCHERAAQCRTGPRFVIYTIKTRPGLKGYGE